MKYSYQTENVCPRIIQFNLEGNVVTDVEYLGGGCPGNLQALPRLVEGLTVEEIQKKLAGIQCGRKPTSCADQLAKAVLMAYEESKKNK